MGKYRDHRSPRRGHEEVLFSSSDSPTEPNYFQHSHDKVSAPLEAQVMWFNADKGFGFVKAIDGSEAYLHVRELEGAGKSSVSVGTDLTVRIKEGPKGLHVSQVLEIKHPIAQPALPDREARRPTARAEMNAPEEEGAGTVKFYNPDKGFGFIGLEGGEKDVFVHASVLNRSGLGVLTQGQKVRLMYAKGPKGLEARTVQPMANDAKCDPSVTLDAVLP
jgi:cold shock protein